MDTIETPLEFIAAYFYSEHELSASNLYGNVHQEVIEVQEHDLHSWR